MSTSKNSSETKHANKQATKQTAPKKNESENLAKPKQAQISQAQKKQFRTIGHSLNPVVIIGESGLSTNVQKELNRALEDHELIKVKIPAGERSEKQKLIDELCASENCVLIQKVGNMILIYRAARKPNPKLSNILKAHAI